MPDDQDKELDRFGNNGNESPDNPAKNEENPTLIAGLPKPKPRSLYPVNGGKPQPPLVIPGGKPGVTPQPSPTPGERPANARGNFAPGATLQPSSTPNPNSQGQPISNISEQRLGASAAEALGLDRPPVWWDPLGQMRNTERRVNAEAEASRGNNPATPQIPPSQAIPGLDGMGRDANNINREIRRSPDNSNNHPPSSATTSVDGTNREIIRRNQELRRAQESLRRNPTTTPATGTPAPTLPNPFGDPNLP
jgi:hypothetical protein